MGPDAFNVLNASFGTRIHTSCATDDHRSVENLLQPGRSLSQEERNRRVFQPAGFHSPPIYITIALPVALELVGIYLDPHVGTHGTEKLALFTSAESVSLSPTYQPATQSEHFRHVHSPDQLQSKSSWLFLSEHTRFMRQVQQVYETAKPAVVVLRRPLRYMHPIRSIQIKLLKGKNSRVCPLRSLEVWCSFRGNSMEAERFWARYNKRSPELVSLVSDDSPPMINLADSDEEEDNTPLPTMPIHPSLLRKRRSEQADDTRESVIRKTEWMQVPYGGTLSPLFPDDLEQYLKDQNITIPDRYVDPISCSIMLRPCVTPTGQRLDTATLTTHFQNSTTDPFSGLPMRIEEAVEDISLRHEIERFLREQQTKREKKKK